MLLWHWWSNFASLPPVPSSVRDCSNFSYNEPKLLSALVEIGCYTKQIGFLKRERCDLSSKLPWNVAARHSISSRFRRRDLLPQGDLEDEIYFTEICATNGLRRSGAVEMAFLTWISALDCSQGKEKDEQFCCHLEVKPNNACKTTPEISNEQVKTAHTKSTGSELSVKMLTWV